MVNAGIKDEPISTAGQAENSLSDGLISKLTWVSFFALIFSTALLQRRSFAELGTEFGLADIVNGLTLCILIAGLWLRRRTFAAALCLSGLLHMLVVAIYGEKLFFVIQVVLFTALWLSTRMGKKTAV